MMVVVLVEPGDVLVKEEGVVLAANGDPKRQSLIILVEVRAVLRENSQTGDAHFGAIIVFGPYLFFHGSVVC